MRADDFFLDDVFPVVDGICYRRFGQVNILSRVDLLQTGRGWPFVVKISLIRKGQVVSVVYDGVDVKR